MLPVESGARLVDVPGVRREGSTQALLKRSVRYRSRLSVQGASSWMMCAGSGQRWLSERHGREKLAPETPRENDMESEVFC